MSIISWAEIQLFHSVRKYTTTHPEILNGVSKVSYLAKCKLHGTNAAIQCHKNGSIISQSRTAELSAEKDNYGFAKWVLQNQEHWQKLKNDLAIFGEWSGKGIQSDVAISSIPKKIFAVFAARPLSSDELIVEPDTLMELVKNIPDTYVLPWHNHMLDIDWSKSDEELSKKTDTINKWVLSIEQQDPWVKEIFNIEGVGEGLVFYPVSAAHLGNANFTNLSFKAKGERHRVMKSNEPAQINPEIAGSISQFVELVLTEARLQQGASTVGESLDIKFLGKFIGWISQDVQKEAKLELEASKLEWKQVSKAVADKARAWYQNKLK